MLPACGTSTTWSIGCGGRRQARPSCWSSTTCTGPTWRPSGCWPISRHSCGTSLPSCSPPPVTSKLRLAPPPATPSTLLEGYAGHIRLRGLDIGQMPALVGSVADEVDAGALHHHTGGNPLFALEMARLLDAQRTGSTLVAGDMPPVPATVRGVLTRRLDALTPDCRAALDVATVVGEEFGLDVVEMVTGLGRDRLLELVDEAVRAHVLRDAGVAAYAFTHPLVRATLYDDLRIARRVRLHERVGVALEARRVQGGDVDPAALAHHFLEAAPGGTAAKAASYALEAASRAMAHLAYESAVGLYEQALAVLELDPTAADRCEVLLGLGAAELAAGRQPVARAVHLEAAELARAAGRADRVARAALGVGGGGGFEVALGDREQIDLLEEARRGLGSEPSAIVAQVTARLSVALSLSGADERRLELSEEALAMARAVGDADAGAGLRLGRALRRHRRASRHRAPADGGLGDRRPRGVERRSLDRAARAPAPARRPPRTRPHRRRRRRDRGLRPPGRCCPAAPLRLVRAPVAGHAGPHARRLRLLCPSHRRGRRPGRPRPQ